MVEEEPVTSKKLGKIKSSAVRDLGVRPSEKKKSIARKKSPSKVVNELVDIVARLDEVDKEKEKKERKKVTRAMAKRLTVESVSVDAR